MKKAIILFSCFMLVINTSVFCQEWSKEQKDVWQVSQKMEEFWAKRDLDGYMSCLHENFIGWFNEDPLPIDKNSLRNWESHWLGTVKIIRSESKPVSINVTGDIAISNCYSQALRQDANGTKLTYSKWTDIYKRENGKWLIIGMSGGKILED